MLTRLGSLELIIILVIVLLVFGAGRISKLGKEAGQAIHSFKTGLEEDEKTNID